MAPDDWVLLTSKSRSVAARAVELEMPLTALFCTVNEVSTDSAPMPWAHPPPLTVSTELPETVVPVVGAFKRMP